MTKQFKKPRSKENISLARITRKLVKLYPFTDSAFLYTLSKKYCRTNGITKNQFYGVLSQSWSHGLHSIDLSGFYH